MASLEGHLVPGIFFIIFGLWWSFITHIRLILTNPKSSYKSNRHGYLTSVTMPCICCPGPRLKRAPIESYVKFLFTLIGFLIESIAGLLTYHPPAPYFVGPSSGGGGHQHGGAGETTTMAAMMMNASVGEHHHDHDHGVHKRDGHDEGEGILIKSWFPMEINNAQHTTMYVAFMFGALIELLVYHRVHLPRFLDHAFGLLGFSVECFLFAFHLHGRSAIDVHVHTLLVYSIFGCIAFTCLEIYNPTQILFTYGRCLFTLIQGTWFCQAGFVLYPPTTNGYWQWDPDNHVHIMMLTLAYCWHVMIWISLLLVEYFFLKRLYGRSKHIASQWDELAVIDEERAHSHAIHQYRQSHNHNETKFLRLTNDDEESGDERVEFDSSILRGQTNYLDGVHNKSSGSFLNKMTEL